ncbi:MlaC/ttg2D family ABC transporter substrate-binding protein [Hirschia maritima]|uniref:MlaC/ttg2D family ABC transporter substrate-binding protein n=1 Tax=Hirschia maritima TaxID=1121961 RepID=UPI00035C817B|nr:ABC transporter substrate-binding protein [Hirschia maritima]
MNILKKIATFTLAGALITSTAWADEKSEAYVEENANTVLNTLNQPDLTEADRTAQFNEYMNTFANMDKVARFAVGRYGRQFTKDEFEAYSDAFITYALAVYEVQLDRFRGEKIEVVGSVDLGPGDSVVKTKILAPNAGKKFNVEWRVRLDKNSNEYKVLDVALNIDGSQIWLAQEQQAQFVSLLDRSNGSAKVLIERINAMTAKLQREKELAQNSLNLFEEG